MCMRLPLNFGMALHLWILHVPTAKPKFTVCVQKYCSAYKQLFNQMFLTLATYKQLKVKENIDSNICGYCMQDQNLQCASCSVSLKAIGNASVQILKKCCLLFRFVLLHSNLSK